MTYCSPAMVEGEGEGIAKIMRAADCVLAIYIVFWEFGNTWEGFTPLNEVDDDYMWLAPRCRRLLR